MTERPKPESDATIEEETLDRIGDAIVELRALLYARGPLSMGAVDRLMCRQARAPKFIVRRAMVALGIVPYQAESPDGAGIAWFVRLPDGADRGLGAPWWPTNAESENR